MKVYFWRAVQIAVILYFVLAIGVDDILLKLRH